MENIKEKIHVILEEVLKEFADEKGLEELAVINSETKLYGQGGIFSSLALVRLAVELEEAVSEEFCRDITIVDERAMSRKNSPFRDVGSLVDYLAVLIEGEN